MIDFSCSFGASMSLVLLDMSMVTVDMSMVLEDRSVSLVGMDWSWLYLYPGFGAPAWLLPYFHG